MKKIYLVLAVFIGIIAIGTNSIFSGNDYVENRKVVVSTLQQKFVEGDAVDKFGNLDLTRNGKFKVCGDTYAKDFLKKCLTNDVVLTLGLTLAEVMAFKKLNWEALHIARLPMEEALIELEFDVELAERFAAQ